MGREARGCGTVSGVTARHPYRSMADAPTAAPSYDRTLALLIFAVGLVLLIGALQVSCRQSPTHDPTPTGSGSRHAASSSNTHDDT